MEEIGDNMDEYQAKIEALRTRIYKLNMEVKELNKQIRELKQRCIRQSDEIVSLKSKLFKEGYYDNTRS